MRDMDLELALLIRYEMRRQPLVISTPFLYFYLCPASSVQP